MHDAGDPVCICIITTAAAQVESGFMTCTVLAARCHWLNVDAIAGAFTVTMVKTSQSSVAMVSANGHYNLLFWPI